VQANILERRITTGAVKWRNAVEILVDENLALNTREFCCQFWLVGNASLEQCGTLRNVTVAVFVPLYGASDICRIFDSVSDIDIDSSVNHCRI
jgi:hypothetical protein